MNYLLIKGLSGQIEMLPGFDANRSKKVNGDMTLSVVGTKDEGNDHSYPLVQNEARFIYDEEEYVIKQHTERTVGNTIKVDAKAIHAIFEDLTAHRIYEKMSGTILVNDLMSFSLAGSGYTFEVDFTDLSTSIIVDKFGDNTSLSLVKNIWDLIGAEFDVSGKHIFVAKQLGRVTDYQVRHKLNVKDPSKDIDTSNFFTYIRGYGKDGLMVEYTSPLAAIYGIKHAPPVRDDKYTDSASLLARITRDLNDSIDISIKLTYVELVEMGIQDIQKGDYVWCILDPFDIDLLIRVVQVDDSNDPFKSPVYTLGNITKKATDIMKDYRKTKSIVEKVVDVKTNMVNQNVLKIGQKVTFESGYDPTTKVDTTTYESSSSDHATLFWMGGM